jgi:predicted signal transduction protein with EAL and GGDEF domain
LICGLDRSPRQRQLVRSVVRLCIDLDALVVAEGIETRDEYSPSWTRARTSGRAISSRGRASRCPS